MEALLKNNNKILAGNLQSFSFKIKVQSKGKRAVKVSNSFPITTLSFLSRLNLTG